MEESTWTNNLKDESHAAQRDYIEKQWYPVRSRSNNPTLSNRISSELREQGCQIQIYKTRSWPGDSYLKLGENSGDFYRNQEAFWWCFFEENWNFRLHKRLIFSPDKLIMAKFFYLILNIYIIWEKIKIIMCSILLFISQSFTKYIKGSCRIWIIF